MISEEEEKEFWASLIKVETHLETYSLQGTLLSTLPLVFCNGYPADLYEISEDRLEKFVTYMLLCMFGTSDFSNISEPDWWPPDMQFAVPVTKPDFYPYKWLMTLRSVVCRCYCAHGMEFILHLSARLSLMPQASLCFVESWHGTTSLYFVGSGRLVTTFRTVNRYFDHVPAKLRDVLFEKRSLFPPEIIGIFMCESCSGGVSSYTAVKEKFMDALGVERNICCSKENMGLKKFKNFRQIKCRFTFNFTKCTYIPFSSDLGSRVRHLYRKLPFLPQIYIDKTDRFCSNEQRAARSRLTQGHLSPGQKGKGSKSKRRNSGDVDWCHTYNFTARYRSAHVAAREFASTSIMSRKTCVGNGKQREICVNKASGNVLAGCPDFTTCLNKVTLEEVQHSPTEQQSVPNRTALLHNLQECADSAHSFEIESDDMSIYDSEENNYNVNRMTDEAIIDQPHDSDSNSYEEEIQLLDSCSNPSSSNTSSTNPEDEDDAQFDSTYVDEVQFLLPDDSYVDFNADELQPEETSTYTNLNDDELHYLRPVCSENSLPENYIDSAEPTCSFVNLQEDEENSVDVNNENSDLVNLTYDDREYVTLLTDEGEEVAILSHRPEIDHINSDSVNMSEEDVRMINEETTDKEVLQEIIIVYENISPEIIELGNENGTYNYVDLTNDDSDNEVEENSYAYAHIEDNGSPNDSSSSSDDSLSLDSGLDNSCRESECSYGEEVSFGTNNCVTEWDIENQRNGNFPNIVDQIVDVNDVIVEDSCNASKPISSTNKGTENVRILSEKAPGTRSRTAIRDSVCDTQEKNSSPSLLSTLPTSVTPTLASSSISVQSSGSTKAVSPAFLAKTRKRGRLCESSSNSNIVDETNYKVPSISSEIANNENSSDEKQFTPEFTNRSLGSDINKNSGPSMKLRHRTGGKSETSASPQVSDASSATTTTSQAEDGDKQECEFEPPLKRRKKGVAEDETPYNVLEEEFAKQKDVYKSTKMINCFLCNTCLTPYNTKILDRTLLKSSNSTIHCTSEGKNEINCSTSQCLQKEQKSEGDCVCDNIENSASVGTTCLLDNNDISASVDIIHSNDNNESSTSVDTTILIDNASLSVDTTPLLDNASTSVDTLLDNASIETVDVFATVGSVPLLEDTNASKLTDNTPLPDNASVSADANNVPASVDSVHLLHNADTSTSVDTTCSLNNNKASTSAGNNSVSTSANTTCKLHQQGSKNSRSSTTSEKFVARVKSEPIEPQPTNNSTSSYFLRRSPEKKHSCSCNEESSLHSPRNHGIVISTDRRKSPRKSSCIEKSKENKDIKQNAKVGNCCNAKSNFNDLVAETSSSVADSRKSTYSLRSCKLDKNLYQSNDFPTCSKDVDNMFSPGVRRSLRIISSRKPENWKELKQARKPENWKELKQSRKPENWKELKQNIKNETASSVKNTRPYFLRSSQSEKESPKSGRKNLKSGQKSFKSRKRSTRPGKKISKSRKRSSNSGRNNGSKLGKKECSKSQKKCLKPEKDSLNPGRKIKVEPFYSSEEELCKRSPNKSTSFSAVQGLDIKPLYETRSVTACKKNSVLPLNDQETSLTAEEISEEAPLINKIDDSVIKKERNCKAFAGRKKSVAKVEVPDVKPASSKGLKTEIDENSSADERKTFCFKVSERNENNMKNEINENEMLKVECVKKEIMNDDYLVEVDKNDKIKRSINETNEKEVRNDVISAQVLHREVVNKKATNARTMNEKAVNSETVNGRVVNQKILNREAVNAGTIHGKVVKQEVNTIKREAIKQEIINEDQMKQDTIKQEIKQESFGNMYDNQLDNIASSSTYSLRSAKPDVKHVLKSDDSFLPKQEVLATNLQEYSKENTSVRRSSLFRESKRSKAAKKKVKAESFIYVKDSDENDTVKSEPKSTIPRELQRILSDECKELTRLGLVRKKVKSKPEKQSKVDQGTFTDVLEEDKHSLHVNLTRLIIAHGATCAVHLPLADFLPRDDSEKSSTEKNSSTGKAKSSTKRTNSSTERKSSSKEKTIPSSIRTRSST